MSVLGSTMKHDGIIVSPICRCWRQRTRDGVMSGRTDLVRTVEQAEHSGEADFLPAGGGKEDPSRASGGGGSSFCGMITGWEGPGFHGTSQVSLSVEKPSCRSAFTGLAGDDDG